VDAIILISGMFLATYSVRYFPLALANRLKFAPWVQYALSYVPVAALSAIIAPLIFLDTDKALHLAPDNVRLISALVAFAIAYKTKNLLLTVVLGLGIFAVLQYLQ